MCCDSDTDPKIAAAAAEQAQMGRDALSFYRERETANAPRQAALDEISGKVSRQQLDTADFAAGVAKDEYQRYLDKGVPVQNKMFDDAMNYDSTDRQMEAAGQAGTDVQQNLALAKDASARDMAKMGVNPNSARFQSTRTTADTAGALAEAGAENAARMRVRESAVGLRQNAANIIRTMPGTAAQAAGVASSASQGALTAATAPIATSNATTATTGTGYQIGLQGVGAGGNLLLQQQNAQLQAKAAQDAALVGAVSTAASTYGTRSTYRPPASTSSYSTMNES